MPNRPTWDEYFLGLLPALSARATCRGKASCVFTRDNHILVTGYVGSPPGLPHCEEVGHLIRKVEYEDGTIKEHCVRTIHAEQNAIAYAARAGIALDGAKLYVSMTPCEVCTRMLIAAGIKEVVCEYRYKADAGSLAMFETSGIKITHIKQKLRYTDTGEDQ